MTTGPERIAGRWGQRARDFGLVIWVSFLAASVGTLVIFAVLDPDALNDAWVLPWEVGRKLAYSLGFLFLFCVSLLASALTVFMIRTGPSPGHRAGRGPRPPPQVKHAAADDPELGLDPKDWR
jgi:hypothetical protein